jgi:putative DNA primase/helicase
MPDDLRLKLHTWPAVHAFTELVPGIERPDTVQLPWVVRAAIPGALPAAAVVYRDPLDDQLLLEVAQFPSVLSVPLTAVTVAADLGPSRRLLPLLAIIAALAHGKRWPQKEHVDAFRALIAHFRGAAVVVGTAFALAFHKALYVANWTPDPDLAVVESQIHSCATERYEGPTLDRWIDARVLAAVMEWWQQSNSIGRPLALQARSAAANPPGADSSKSIDCTRTLPAVATTTSVAGPAIEPAIAMAGKPAAPSPLNEAGRSPDQPDQAAPPPTAQPAGSTPPPSSPPSPLAGPPPRDNAPRLEHARWWRQKGYWPIPVEPEGKKPIGIKWQKQRLSTDADLERAFGGPNAGRNLGVLCGIPDGHIDIDLELIESVRAWQEIGPETSLRFGREGKPNSHHFYRSDPPVSYLGYEFPAKRADGHSKNVMVLEVRCLETDGIGVGHHTVVPGSIHQDTGQLIRFERGAWREPANVDQDVLVRCASLTASAVALALHAPAEKGGRHSFMIAVAGLMARAGQPEQDALKLVRAIYRILWPDNPDFPEAESDVRSTYAKLADEGFVTSYRRLGELLSEISILRKVCQWLGIDRPQKETRGAGKGRIPTCAVADRITAEFPFARDPGGLLYFYGNGVYRPHAENLIRRRTKEIYGKEGKSDDWTSTAAEESIKYILADCPELWEEPPAGITNIENGLLNMATRELLPHTPEHRSIIRVPIRFDPAARCPLIEKFVGQVFPGDSGELAYEIAAWLLEVGRYIQTAVLLLGEGANGKSTFLELLRCFLGRINTVSVALQRLEVDKFAVASLYGKLANICPDLPGEKLAGTSVFKAITGGDHLQAEYKYHDSFSFRPFAKLIFSANRMPQSPDDSDAFFRRWLVLPFHARFAKDSPDRIEQDVLLGQLSQGGEFSGFLNRALEAGDRLRKERGFTETATAREAATELRRTTDPFIVWLAENTTFVNGACIPQIELRDGYRKACEKEGRPAPTAMAITAKLKSIHPAVQLRQKRMSKSELRPHSIRGTDRPWCYFGIGWLTTVNDEGSKPVPDHWLSKYEN